MSKIVNRKGAHVAKACIIAGLFLFEASACMHQERSPEAAIPSDPVRTVMSIHYAQGFTVEQFDEYRRITVHNPWQGAQHIVIRYYLVNESKQPEGLPVDAWKQEGTKIKIFSADIFHEEK